MSGNNQNVNKENKKASRLWNLLISILVVALIAALIYDQYAQRSVQVKQKVEFSFVTLLPKNSPTPMETLASTSNNSSPPTLSRFTAEPTATASPNSNLENIAPDFRVYDADGRAVHLTDYLGKPVVVNLWASWSDPCTKELPYFNKLAKEYSGQVIFLMVNSTDGVSETKESVQSYIKNTGFTFDVFFDTSSSIKNAYSANSIPMTLFIDKNSNLVGGFNGAIDEETLRAAIDLIK